MFDTLAFFLWANPRRSHIGFQAESRTLLCSTLQKTKKETLNTAIHATHCIPKRGVNFGTLLQHAHCNIGHCNTLHLKKKNVLWNTLIHSATRCISTRGAFFGSGWYFDGAGMHTQISHTHPIPHTHTHPIKKVSVCQSIEMRIWKDSTTRALMRTCEDSYPPSSSLYSIFPPPTTFALTLLNPSCNSCLLCQNSPIKIGLFCGRDWALSNEIHFDILWFVGPVRCFATRMRARLRMTSVRVTHITVSIQHATIPKSTKSENSDFSASRGTDSIEILVSFEFVTRNASVSIWWICGV